MTSPTWDPHQYERFAVERARPFHDLVGRIPTPAPRQVVDLGCGPGTTTATLVDRWPGGHVLGLDSSPAMLARAQRLAEPGRLEFRSGDIARWQPTQASLDAIIANASLQWVPNHPDLLPGWVNALRPGGALAFQMPAAGGADPGEVFREVAAAPRWAARLASVTMCPGPRTASPVRPVDEYVDRLARLDTTVDAWETTYHHVLAGPDAVLEWSSGTGLRPYLDALSGDEAALNEFRAAVAVRLRETYPPRPYGTVLPFHRIFVVASR
ncbi:MAG TPA: methyltransferase domain-containing protein [Micromonosporaceae bacterium]|nr:methyltransferase domain-containing protein [Micromonosporaceae bacterium]